MSREIKYIGMDVHKEAIVIAVLNNSGKLVMESIARCSAHPGPAHDERSLPSDLDCPRPNSGICEPYCETVTSG